MITTITIMIMTVKCSQIIIRTKSKMQRMKTIITNAKKRKEEKEMEKKVTSTSICHGLVRECTCPAMHVIRFVSSVVR